MSELRTVHFRLVWSNGDKEDLQVTAASLEEARSRTEAHVREVMLSPEARALWDAEPRRHQWDDDRLYVDLTPSAA